MLQHIKGGKKMKKANKQETVRFNIFLSEDQKEYIRDYSERFGISMSSAIKIMISSYQQQEQALENLKKWTDSKKLIDSEEYRAYLTYRTELSKDPNAKK